MAADHILRVSVTEQFELQGHTEPFDFIENTVKIFLRSWLATQHPLRSCCLTPAQRPLAAVIENKYNY